MSRRAAALVLGLLAVFLAYGWYVVPLLLAPAEDMSDLDHAAAQVHEELDAYVKARKPTASSSDDMNVMVGWRLKALQSSEFRERSLRELREIVAKDERARQTRGKVIASQPGDRVVMIDIGSHAGVYAGQPLEAHRDGPVAFQVNNLRVLEVLPDRAVAWVVTRSPPVRVGDEVRYETWSMQPSVKAFVDSVTQ